MLTATSASVTGTINAQAGVFKGTVDVGSATDTGGVLRVSAGSGTILIGTNALINGTTTAAITASSGGTTNFYVRASDGYLFSQYGKIGGWDIGTSKLSGGGGSSAVGLQIDATAGGYAFWAGAGTPDANTPFSVTNTGALRATGATISGAITVTSGRIGNQTTGWEIDGSSIKSVGSPSGTTQLFLNSSTGTISGGTISGTKLIASAFEFTAGSDYLKSDGSFRLGNGILSYSGSDIIVSGNFKFAPDANGMVPRVIADDNEWGNSSSVSVNTNGELTRGRTFYYGSTTIPGSGNTSRAVYNRATNSYETVSFVAGDIWMTVD